VVNGGEDPSGCGVASDLHGAIYNPVTDSWKALSPPPGWSTIGDAQSVILANKKYMLANCCTRQQAILNAGTLTWTSTKYTTKAEYNRGEGWALLHDGSVLTADAYWPSAYTIGRPCGRNTERYIPRAKSWVGAGDATTRLSNCPYDPPAVKTGPIVVRPDGSAVAFSGAEPGTSIYNPAADSWRMGPNIRTLTPGISMRRVHLPWHCRTGISSLARPEGRADGPRPISSSLM
jgi:hypothetical protein